MKRGISRECADSTLPVLTIAAEANAKGGSTNIIAVATTLSGFWQQDIEQAIKPTASWLQSPLEAGRAGVFW
jgi:hypothetical protein